MTEAALRLRRAKPGVAAPYNDALFDRYRHTLEELGRQPGPLAVIFGKSANLPPHLGALV